MGKFSKMNRFTVLESQNRLGTSSTNADNSNDSLHECYGHSIILQSKFAKRMAKEGCHHRSLAIRFLNSLQPSAMIASTEGEGIPYPENFLAVMGP